MSRLAAILFATLISALPLSGALAQQLRKITFLTDAGPLGRHSIFFVAQAKGYYKEEGLDVDIGGTRLGPYDLRSCRRSCDLWLRRFRHPRPFSRKRRCTGQDDWYRLRASATRTDGNGKQRHKRSEDFVGKKLADTSASSNYILFKVYAQKTGVDSKSVEWISTDFDFSPWAPRHKAGRCHWSV